MSAPRRLDGGIDPTLVFKIRARSRPDDSHFAGRNLQVLGETVDFTYFVLSDDEGSTLSDAIAEYTRSGTLRSFFDVVDDVEPYGPEDRRGPGLDGLEGDGPWVLDVTIWPSGTYQEAEARFGVLSNVLGRNDGEIQLQSVRTRRSYVRVRVSAVGLADLLDTSVVESVRTPPAPFLDFRDWHSVAFSDLTLAREASAVVGVLDDAPATHHPLLDGLVLSSESLAPASYAWQQSGSHGTEVVGRVLYPNLAEELRDGQPLTAHGKVRIVRILEPDPTPGSDGTRFATYDLPHVIVEQAIRHLHEQYGVKIFNLSVGYTEPFNELHVGPLTETIDDLIQELKIVVVVPTGNVGLDIEGRTPSGHHVLEDKPNHFFTPEHRLTEPGPAALAVTCGAVAQSGAPAELPGHFGWRAVAEADEASPFSRTGPGLGTSARRLTKPEVVHHGGNTVITDTGQSVTNDVGASLVSTSYRTGDSRLFATVNGTSFAGPPVARISGDIEEAYPDASGNLIRALLASSARPPAGAATLEEGHRRFNVYGHGMPDRDRAISSDGQRTTMTYDGDLAVDTVQIHPMSVPEIFRRGSGGERSITLALAFDPPVRRQRREYLAGTFKLDVYRDIEFDELASILQRQDQDDSNDPITDRRRLSLLPGSNSFSSSAVHLRRWTVRNSFANDDETFYVVATHKAQTWARNDPGYTRQTYALAVTLEDQYLVQADLRDLLTAQVRVPARVRLRG